MAETKMPNEMRRLLAHLGVPRTADELGARLKADPDAGGNVDSLLDEAQEKSWVVGLGSFDTPADVVEAVAKDDESIDFGRGQAKIWQARAEGGRYSVRGDLYILSREGHEALQGTDEDEEE